LGPPEAEPPLEVLPAPLRLMVGAVGAVLAQLGMTEHERPEPLRGAGIGSAAYRGRARRATSAEEALDALEAGDVLVVPFTTPSYNTVLSLAGAVVTSEGGPLCHAAVLARELGIPGVIGAPGALTEIPDGAEVEVDPVAGLVTVLRAAGAADADAR
jgi:pyruvate,water dikinase